MDNMEEMDKFLEKHTFPRLNQEEIENMKGPIISTDWDCDYKFSNKQETRTRGLHMWILSNI